MKQQCKICEKIFDYCNHCAITKNPFKNAGYCDEDCYHISMSLQKYISKDATAENIFSELILHNVNSKILKSAIQSYYNDVLSVINQKEEIVHEDVEVVIDNDKDMTISENE